MAPCTGPICMWKKSSNSEFHILCTFSLWQLEDVELETAVTYCKKIVYEESRTHTESLQNLMSLVWRTGCLCLQELIFVAFWHFFSIVFFFWLHVIILRFLWFLSVLFSHKHHMEWSFLWSRCERHSQSIQEENTLLPCVHERSAPCR